MAQIDKWQTLLADFHMTEMHQLHMPSDTHGAETNQSKMRSVATALKREMNLKLALMFATDEEEGPAVWYVYIDRAEGHFYVVKMPLSASDLTYATLGDLSPTALFYEREIHDLFGYKAVGHPNLKPMVRHANWPLEGYPLRKSFAVDTKMSFESHPVPFATVAGEGVFEIPVGPVHAGIIEPGHFRFSVAGEPIINLEAQLYYVHKGLEKLAEGSSYSKGLLLAERVSGDETLANALAYCQALERIAGVDVPLRARLIRVIFAELERLTAHFGDLAGICLDVAYGFAAFQFRMLRGWSYFLADELCSQRFLRNVVVPGGVRKEFIRGKEGKIFFDLQKIKKELAETKGIITAKASFIDRIENTGILDTKTAMDLYATGPAGRASGVSYDMRSTFNYAAYKDLSFNVSEHHNGDVNCRLNVKIEEAEQSLAIIGQAVGKLQEMDAEEKRQKGSVKNVYPDNQTRIDLPELPENRWTIGYAEAPRGENLHFILTGSNNTLKRYKVRTASFCNWPAVCHAVKGNIVPDFPLINKSFNLSYAGNDL